jgi:magnesium-transporting ATPase (P-type)
MDLEGSVIDAPERAGWHAMPADEVLRRLETGREGLTDREARRRLSRYGPNRLPEPARTSPLVRFLLQFHNILIYVLLVAAAVTSLLGHWTDTAVIVGVVFINAIIGFIQEGRAERAMEAVRDLLAPEATVIRDGRRLTIPAEELVPGDLVLLESGGKVPADMRLVRAKNLRVQEALLTGESLPVSKTIDVVLPNAPVGDRLSMAFSGTIVTSGQAAGVVVATGANTEIGRISGTLGSIEEVTTPLIRRLQAFGWWLSAAILAISAATFAFGTLVRNASPGEMFMAAVGIAVAAIPEGLPAIMTITLAIGVQRMAARNAIIRRLPAVETLGSATVICSDKTGTLTRNELTVRTIALPGRDIVVEGVGYEPRGRFLRGDRELTPSDEPELIEALRMGLLCSDVGLRRDNGSWTIVGDPTEGALVVAAAKAGLDQKTENEKYPRIDAIPFESEHRFMATLHQDATGSSFIVIKGAPERILEMCEGERRNGDVRPLDAERWHEHIDRMASQAQRPLAVAMRPSHPDQRGLDHDHVRGGFVLLAVFGLIDPPRPEAISAISECHQAGITVKMITGDHARTAQAIGRELGITRDSEVMTGRDLDQTNDEDLRKVAARVHVFARTSPEHKLRLVEALQADGHVVAMTGDGVNDAPALKRADIGIAMGRKGTEAAKEASEMVLADDNFATIAAAVREGRVVYDNLQKTILFILPTNGGEAFTIIAAILLGYQLPATPLQIMWVNMATAVTLGIALAFEPAEKNVMKRQPRPVTEPILTPFGVWRVAFVSALIVAATLGMFLWDIANGAPIAEARTIAVNVIVMAEVFYLFNARFIRDSSFNLTGLFGSRAVLAAIAMVVALQLAFTHLPIMQQLFGTQDLNLLMWSRVVIMGALVFLLVELEKAVLRWLWDRPAEPRRSQVA